MARPAIPSRVRQLAEDAATALRVHLPNGARIVWFGSWVLGTAAERSDIDLAVDADRLLTPEELQRLHDALDALPTLRAFDVVDLHALSDARREQVLLEGIDL
jgi:predicted nucleotidyltransferase